MPTVVERLRLRTAPRRIGTRSAWARSTGLSLEIPVHYCIKLGEAMRIADKSDSGF